MFDFFCLQLFVCIHDFYTDLSVKFSLAIFIGLDLACLVCLCSDLFRFCLLLSIFLAYFFELYSQFHALLSLVRTFIKLILYFSSLELLLALAVSISVFFLPHFPSKFCIFVFVL